MKKFIINKADLELGLLFMQTAVYAVSFIMGVIYWANIYAVIKSFYSHDEIPLKKSENEPEKIAEVPAKRYNHILSDDTLSKLKKVIDNLPKAGSCLPVNTGIILS